MNTFFKGLLTIVLAVVALPALATPSTSYYIYDESGHVIGEYDANGNPVQEHIYLGDKPVAVVQGGTVDNVTTDQLDAPRAVMDAGKNVVWSWNSDPFGNGQPTGSLTYNLRFPGQYYDAETGHNYNANRDYDPTIGRYVESDPTGLGGGINTYAYADDDPIDMNDPLGLLAWNSGGTSWESDLAPGRSYMIYPGGYSDPNNGYPLGRTTVDWKVSSDCECDGHGGYKFVQFTVSFHAIVHMRSSYPDGAREASWVRHAEMDHVSDFTNWANTAGRQLAEQVEEGYKGRSFPSLEDCKTLTERALNAGLQTSFAHALQQSISAYDTSGLHTYGGP